MSHKKKGANQGDQNFIQKCAAGGNDWTVERISNHLRIEERVVQSFYDLFSGKTEPKDVKKDVTDADFVTPAEEFA